MLKTRCTPDYLMRVIMRRLIARDVLPDGPIVGGSHQMMSDQLQEPFQILICPINLPTDNSCDADVYGTITNGVFHVYYRHRDILDTANTDDVWLNDPDFGYYAKLTKAMRALRGWWPIGDLADSKENRLLTTNVLKVHTFNEPRRKYVDRSLGEGMFEVRARFVMDQEQVGPLV